VTLLRREPLDEYEPREPQVLHVYDDPDALSEPLSEYDPEPSLCASSSEPSLSTESSTLARRGRPWPCVASSTTGMSTRSFNAVVRS
jgi:hypothetical protein